MNKFFGREAKTSLIYLLIGKGDDMDLKVIETILDSYLKERDLSLFDVELVKEFGYLILRVSIDKKGGIDVNELAEVNEYLSERLDKYDQDMPEYMLEVCSPGAEKPLRNLSEISQNIGAYIHIEVENMIYEGVLMNLENDNLTVRINAKGRFKNVVLKYEEIKLIRLAVKL